MLVAAVGLPASAQVMPRLMDGGIIGYFGGNDNSITRNGTETCPCPPNRFPLGALTFTLHATSGTFTLMVPDGATIHPASTFVSASGTLMAARALAGSTTASGAFISASQVGAPIQVTQPSAWTLDTSGVIGPPLIAPPIISVTTMFTAQNATGTFAAGGGPGTTTTNPLRSTSYPGGTTFQTTLPFGTGTLMTTLTRDTIPVRADSVFAAVYTAGPRQFGGTLRIMNFTGRSFRASTTNPPGIIQEGPAGAEQPIGTPLSGPSSRLYVHQTSGTVNPVFGVRFGGQGWTTGTVTVRHLDGMQTSFAVAGFDVGPTMTPSLTRRSVQLVVPDNVATINQQNAPDGTGLAFQWNMQFLPEPGATASLGAGLGLLGLLYWRRRR